MSGRWFRFYDEAVNDPKVQRLPAPLFRFWINTLCLASKNGGNLPSRGDMEFALRLTDAQLSDLIGKLVTAELLDIDGETLSPHNWNGRQYKSDVSTERVKRFRERHETVSETSPEQSRAETEQKETPSLRSGVPPKPKRKSRNQIPEGFPFKADLDWARSLWLGKGRADLCTLMAEEAEKFRDHHNGKLTASADWPASWRTWARNAIKFSNGAHNGRSNGASRQATAHDNFLAGIANSIKRTSPENRAGAGTQDAGGDSSGETSRPLLASRLHGDAG